MPKKLPDTGSAALTYDDAADIGVFDGRAVNTSRSRATSPAPRTSPGTQQPRRAHRPRGNLVLIVGGALLLGAGVAVVAYGVTTVVVSDRVAARAQADLEAQFAARIALAAEGNLPEAFDPNALIETGPLPEATDFDSSDDVPVILGSPSAVDITNPSRLPGWRFEVPPPRGNALGRIEIPIAGIDWVVVEGVNPDDLHKGPGHMPGTPMPGQYGNAVISGHRTTYGAPFGNLDRMTPGTRFTVETLIGVHTYEVVSVAVVAPHDTWVVQPREGAWLTLITCTPKYTSRQRLIVFAKLVAGPNAGIVATHYGTDYAPPLDPDGVAPSPLPRPAATTTTTISTTSTTPTTTVGATTSTDAATTTAPTTTSTTTPDIEGTTADTVRSH